MTLGEPTMPQGASQNEPAPDEREVVASEVELSEQEHVPHYLIYRENPIYKGMMPLVQKTLEEEGIPIHFHAFPAGTPEEEISGWISEHKDALAGNQLVADLTFWRSISPEDRESLEGSFSAQHEGTGFGPNAQLPNLDRLFERATEDVIGEMLAEKGIRLAPTSGVEKETRFREAKEAIAGMLRMMFEEGLEIPKKVYVVYRNLRDHQPFAEYVNNREYKSGEYDKVFDEADPFPDEPEYDDFELALENDRFERALRTLIFGEIKSWLVEGGIPEESIESIHDVTNENKDKINNPDTWVIADGHVIRNNSNWPGNQPSWKAKNFRLPVVEFFESAVRQGFLTVESDLLEPRVKELVKELLQ